MCGRERPHRRGGKPQPHSEIGEQIRADFFCVVAEIKGIVCCFSVFRSGIQEAERRVAEPRRQRIADYVVFAGTAFPAPQIPQQRAGAVVVVAHTLIEHAPVVKAAGFVEQRVAGVGEIIRQRPVNAVENTVAVFRWQVVLQRQQRDGGFGDAHRPPVVPHGFQRVDAGLGQSPVAQRRLYAFFKDPACQLQPFLRREKIPDQIEDPAQRERGVGGTKVRMPGVRFAFGKASGIPAFKADEMRRQIPEPFGAADVPLDQIFQPQRRIPTVCLLVQQTEAAVQGAAAVRLFPRDEGFVQAFLRLCCGVFIKRFCRRVGFCFFTESIDIRF